MLAASDPVTWAPRRIAVAGTTGAGKTTLARRIAAILDIHHTEIDSLFHGAMWQPRPTFDSDVAAVLAEEAWVIEWQYSSVRTAIVERADTLVWLDLPFRVVLTRLLVRTVRRRVLRERLWNDNVEPPLRTAFTDPDHVIRWGIRTRRKLSASVPPLEMELPALRIVRLESAREAREWLASLADGDSTRRR